MLVHQSEGAGIVKGFYLLCHSMWMGQKFRLPHAASQFCRNKPYFPGLLLQLFSDNCQSMRFFFFFFFNGNGKLLKLNWCGTDIKKRKKDKLFKIREGVPQTNIFEGICAN